MNPPEWAVDIFLWLGGWSVITGIPILLISLILLVVIKVLARK